MAYGRGYYNGYPPYVSVAERRAKAEKKLRQLKKKNPGITPVIIEDGKIAKTWWGKSWNKNLESYADFSNRIGRGRSYVRHGSVLHLEIQRRKVSALVQGSASRPYKVAIEIEKIPKRTWKNLKQESAGKLDSLQELLAGKFPKALGKLFTEPGEGLFPSPGEISFSCSCPDYADMCKHVAAALYGIGARLDQKPALFFTLRDVAIDDLVSQALESKSQELLEKAKKKSDRVIENTDLSSLFGIQLDEEGAPGVPPPESTPVTKKKKTAPARKKQAAGGAKKKPKAPKAGSAVSPKPGDSPAGKVLEAILACEDGIGCHELERRTGLKTAKIYSIISKLKREGKVKNWARGIYTGA